MITSEDFRAVGMRLAIGLHGIAITGVASGDEQGHCEVGVHEGVEKRELRDLRRNFVCVLRHACPVGTKVSAKELESRETGLLVGLLNIDAGVGSEALQALLVGLNHLISTLRGEPMTEQVDNLLFIVGDGIATEQTPLLLVNKQDIAHIDIREVDALGAIEDVQTNGDAGAVLTHFDGLDLSQASHPGLHLEDNLVAYRELTDRLVEEELQVMVLHRENETLHLSIGDSHFRSIGVTIVIQPETGHPVPISLHDGSDTLRKSLDKHEMAQVVAQTGIIGCGVVMTIINNR